MGCWAIVEFWVNKGKFAQRDAGQLFYSGGCFGVQRYSTYCSTVLWNLDLYCSAAYFLEWTKRIEKVS